MQPRLRTASRATCRRAGVVAGEGDYPCPTPAPRRASRRARPSTRPAAEPGQPSEAPSEAPPTAPRHRRARAKLARRPIRRRPRSRRSADGQPTATARHPAGRAGRGAAACPTSRNVRRRPIRCASLADEARRVGDRLEVGQRGGVIMRARGIVEDEVEPAVDRRADRAAAAPHFVAVEMLEVELVAGLAEERARRERRASGNRPSRRAPGTGFRASPRLRARSCRRDIWAPAGRRGGSGGRGLARS